MLVTMRKWLFMVLLFPLLCFAQPIEIKDSAPEVYIVKPGDTLWAIASMYLQQPWQWPELWRTNTQLTNPHLIYPGDEIRLRRAADGSTLIEMVRAPEKMQLKLTPQGQKQLKNRPIDLLPWSIIAPYIRQDHVVTELEFAALPQLLGDHQGTLLFADTDLVLSSDKHQTESFQVVRKHQLLRDSEQQVLGVMVRHVADAVSTSGQPNQGTMIKLADSHAEARPGDKLLSMPPQEPESLALHPATDQRGQVITGLAAHKLMGKFDAVVIDLGRLEVSPGTVMGLYTQGPDVYDREPPSYEDSKGGDWWRSDDRVRQPALKVGQVVVFKTFDKVSYALITDASDTITPGVIVSHP